MTVTQPQAPHLDSVQPQAALPGGSVDILGTGLAPNTGTPANTTDLPTALIGDTPAYFSLVRPTRATLQIPEGALASSLTVTAAGLTSNALNFKVAIPLFEESNPIANPAVDADGNIFVMFSGPRGEAVEVSIHRIGPRLPGAPVYPRAAQRFGPRL